MRGDVDIAADETLADAYATVAAPGADARRPRLHAGRLHQLDRDRADRPAPRRGPPRPPRRSIAEGLSDHYREIFRITRLSDYLTIADPAADDSVPEEARPMTDTTVDVTRDGTTAILRIHGEITGGSEPPIMAAYAEAGEREVDRPRLQPARLHEQRWDRAARDAARPDPARRPAPARRRAVRPLPPDPRADPPRRGDRHPRRRAVRARGRRRPPDRPAEIGATP